jgi:hypothetical protein
VNIRHLRTRQRRMLVAGAIAGTIIGGCGLRAMGWAQQDE